jgi:NADH-quinone oxidoreductase subunit C
MDSKKQFLDSMSDYIDEIIDKPLRLYFKVENENLEKIVSYIFKEMGCRLSTATTTEVYRGIEVLYHFSHDATGTYFCPRIIMPNKEKPKMNSISGIIRGAEWIEREMTELLGVDFDGHPRKEPLLSKNNPDFPEQPFRIRRLS